MFVYQPQWMCPLPAWESIGGESGVYQRQIGSERWVAQILEVLLQIKKCFINNSLWYNQRKTIYSLQSYFDFPKSHFCMAFNLAICLPIVVARSTVPCTQQSWAQDCRCRTWLQGPPAHGRHACGARISESRRLHYTPRKYSERWDACMEKMVLISSIKALFSLMSF